MIRKIVVQSSYGLFEPKKELKDLLEQKGYKSIFQLEARLDQELINYIEQNLNEHAVYEGTEQWTYLSISQIDTSKKWYIDEYDGAESVHQLRYEVINEELNFIRLC